MSLATGCWLHIGCISERACHLTPRDAFRLADSNTSISYNMSYVELLTDSNMSMADMVGSPVGSLREQYEQALSSVCARLDDISAAGALFGQSFAAPRDLLVRAALSAYFCQRVRIDVCTLLECVHLEDVKMSCFRECALLECTRVVNNKLAFCLKEMPYLDIVVDATHPVVVELFVLVKEEI